MVRTTEWRVADPPDRFVDGGERLDAPFCHVYRFESDRIVSFQQYTDSAQWARLIP